MATLLLHKNRFLRLASLIGAIALLVGVSSSVTPRAAGSSPTAIVFKAVASCGSGTFSLRANGTAIASFAAPTTCVCGESVQEVTINSASALAAAGAPGCTDWSLTNTNGIYVSWAKVTVVRKDGNETSCITNASGGCATENPNFCAGYQYGTSWGPGPRPDNDVDGQNNCADADMDNDGIANAADNCSLVPNPTQSDADGNNFGDACDPVDLDNDGLWNNVDNCPTVSNAAQTDTDGDGAGDVCDTGVVAVPWLGSEALFHEVENGGEIILQAVATGPNGNAITLTSATWDKGDGSPVSIPFTNSLVLERPVTYTGSVGQPFTATIRVTDSGGNVYTDTMNIRIASTSRETKVNMAIDKGLWYLHKQLVRTTVDGKTAGFWSNTCCTAINNQIAGTAPAVQAFEINNHRESGDRSKDPYVDDVQYGLRFILASGAGNGTSGILRSRAKVMQGANNPDGNNNNRVLNSTENDHAIYLSGQVMDALVASGSPNKVADVGEATYVRGQTYRTIVQDLIDGYSQGMNDDKGGWLYNPNDGTTSGFHDYDISSSHWWAAGVLAAEAWGLDAPAWVKTATKNGFASGHTPTTTTGSCSWYYRTNNYGAIWDGATNVSAAGLILMAATDMPQSDPLFGCTSRFLAATFNSSLGNPYTMYQLTKAMRTALNNSGQTTPVTMLNGTIDWYAAYADYLINNQNSLGTGTGRGRMAWNNGSSAGGYIAGDMSTAWGVIILSPSLFELPPSAACTASPATIGKFGGNVNFSAAASFHPDATATITGYTWNFGDATAAGSGVTTSHNYAIPASFPTTRNATVTVTDSNGNSATASCPVTIVNNNVPPAVAIAGPYTVCKGSPLTLAATATDEDGTIGATAWDLNSPIDFATIDATGLSYDATAFFAAKAPGAYNIGFRATDNDGAMSSVFSTVKVIAANDPSCNQPPDAVDNAASTLSGTPVTINVLSNDTDPDNNPLTITATTLAANGTVVLNGDGTITYTPNTGFAGTDTFTYTIGDGKGGSDTATVTITVTKRQAALTAGSGTKVFGDADPMLTPTSSGFLGDITVTQTARDGGENVGDYATHAEATGATISNYDVTYTDGVFSITKADSTASATGGAFSYDGNPHAGSCSFAGVNGEVLTGTLTYSSGSAPVAAGSHTVTCEFAGNANYNASSATATITISKVDAACAVTGYSVTYNTAAHTATGTCTGANGESLAGLDLTASTHTNAGTYTDAWTFTDVTGNYNNNSGSVVDVILKAPTQTTLAISTATAAAGAPVTLTATVVSVLPGAGTPDGTVTFMEGATVLGTGTLNASGVATLTTTTLSNGPHTMTATYGESANFLSSNSNAVSTLIYGFAAGGGTFVISDTNATMGKAVTFWGAQWQKINIPSGGHSNASFKGFAMTPAVPTVGATFTSAPGNSVPQPSAVPEYIGIIVTSKVTKSGSNISGTIVKLVVVKVTAGYVADPGHAGTGTIVAFIQ